MPANREQRCPNPCVDWKDWDRYPNEHPPYSYWRWDESDTSQSEQRLGARVYICACLIWTALHDRFLGNRLAKDFPNWSAVCLYYSMVHSLRLVWFALYGSYPTGHANMAHSLSRPGGATAANWEQGDFARGRVKISLRAFQDLLKSEFRSPQLAARLPQLGTVFDEACALRTDSNYESLALAHQYHHRGVPISVEEDFRKTVRAMSEASSMAIEFVCQTLNAALADGRNWIGRGSPYSGNELLCLLSGCVRQKIDRANETCQQTGGTVADWCEGIPGIVSILERKEMSHAAERLTTHLAFSRFDIKRGIMTGFHEKVRSLEDAIRRSEDTLLGQCETL